MDIKKLKDFYKNKRVFVTGHTGFKGTWLCLILNYFGANVTGYSLKPKPQDNFDFYKSINLKKKVNATELFHVCVCVRCCRQNMKLQKGRSRGRRTSAVGNM